MAQRKKGKRPNREQKIKLVEAIEKGDAPTIRSIIQEHSININASISQTTSTTFMAIHEAVKHNKLDIVKLLVELGADITVTNNIPQTPLEQAAHLKHVDIVYYLRITCGQRISEFSQKSQNEIDEMVKQYEKDNFGDVQEKMAYCLALKEGLAGSFTVQMLMFGAEGSGKTSLVARLLGEDHDNSPAPKGTDTKFCMIFANNWRKCEQQDLTQRLHNHYWYHLSTQANERASLASLKDQCFSSASPSLHGAAVTSSLKLPEVDKDEIEEAKMFKDKHAKLPRYFSEDEFCGVICDFSGQTHHLSTNSIFVQKNSVVFIVFKASSSLLTIVKEVHHWLQTVYSVGHDAPGDQYMSELLPTVVLVATHTDEIIGDVTEVTQAIITELTKELSGKPYAKHLVGYRLGIEEALGQYCFFISNKRKEMETFSQLRKAVSEIILPLFNEKHPLLYFKIEKALCSFQKNIVSTTDFHKILTENGFIGEVDGDEFIAALKCFHDKGIILHFQSIPDLENVIFVSPWLLAKLLSYILAACQCSSPAEDKHDSQIEGTLLNRERLSQSIQTNNKAFGYGISPEEVIDFLIKLGFIAKVNADSSFAQENNPVPKEENLFVIPSLMPERRLGCTKMESEFHWSICFRFPDGFLPPIVFHQIVSECIDWNHSRNEAIKWLQLTEILITLDSGQLYGVKFLPEQSSICLDILFQKAQSNSTENRAAVIKFLQSKLEAVCKSFMPVCTPPIAYVCCHNCSIPYIKLEDLKKKSLIPCKDSCTCDNEEEYCHDLLFTGGITDFAQPTSPVEDTFDYAAAKYKLTKQYDTMCKLRDHDLILKTLLPILFAKQVVTEDQRKIIEHRQKQDLDGMKVIIDDVIMPSLGQNMKDKYKGFLVAMEESDDKIFKDIPKKLAVYDYDATKQKLMSEHGKICALPIGILLPILLVKKVVTEKQMKRIGSREKLENKGMSFFIDNVILPTLRNMREKYRGFLEAMEESEDESLQHMAKTLGGSQSVP